MGGTELPRKLGFGGWDLKPGVGGGCSGFAGPGL